jgi:multisubunit Na+/H+ antiporter MnhF subunit
VQGRAEAVLLAVATQSKAVALLACIALVQQDETLLDIALIYALFGWLPLVAVLRFMSLER